MTIGGTYQDTAAFKEASLGKVGCAHADTGQICAVSVLGPQPRQQRVILDQLLVEAEA